MRIALVFMLVLSLPALAGAQPSGERLSTRAAPARSPCRGRSPPPSTTATAFTWR